MMHYVNLIERNKLICLLLVCLLLLVSGHFSAISETNEDILFFTPDINGKMCQPIALSQSKIREITDLNSCFDDTGTVYREIWPYVHHIITCDRTILSMDVSEKRIALLQQYENNVLLRILIWNQMESQYEIFESSKLPLNSYLDTYHDGNEILLNIYPEDFSRGSLFLELSYMNEDWILKCFTDGYTIIARMDDCTGEYIFNDYYEPDLSSEWRYNQVISIAELDSRKIQELFDRYDVLFPYRISLIE